MTEDRKKHLTDPEWNAISKLTRKTKLDMVFDVYQKRNGAAPGDFFAAVSAQRTGRLSDCLCLPVLQKGFS